MQGELKNKMIVNFYDVEDQPVYYTVTAEECAFFQQADIDTAVGFLPVGTIYEIVDFIDTTNSDLDWVKIKMYDGEYYAVLLPEKCTIEEVPVIKMAQKKDGFIKKVINKIKFICKR